MEGRECTFILFQAHARGYLMRKEINCARSEFEDIVRDIDGEVNHLEWKGHIIAIPHFKDFGQVASSGKSLGGSKLLPFKNDGATMFLGTFNAAYNFGGLQSSWRNISRMINGNGMHLSGLIAKGQNTYVNKDGPSGIFTKKHAEEAPDRGSHPLEQPGEKEGAQLMSDRLEPERDDPYSHGRASISRGSSRPSSCPPGGEGETGGSQGEQLDGGGVLESTGDTTTVWSSLGRDCCFQKGSQRRRSLAQDEPHTPEALQLHRNTLAMEMLWLQQAIASRKKYLSLKESLNIS